MSPAEFTAIRTGLGLTQTQLARMIGYGQQHVSDIETGKKPIQQVTSLAIRAMLILGLPDHWSDPPRPDSVSTLARQSASAARS